jgi:hypothetical protein
VTVLIIISGTLTFLAGVVILKNPDLIFGFLQRQVGKVELHVLNVVVRIFFGVLLISQSSISKFPFVIETIGWFCISIAVILTLLGREHFNRLISWALALVETYNRVGGVLIMIFGAFLIYAFV